MAPTVGTNNTLPIQESLKMVSTRNKAGVSKEAKARSKDVFINQVDLAAILEGQAKMQQEFADFKKRSANGALEVRKFSPLKENKDGCHTKGQGKGSPSGVQNSCVSRKQI